MALGSPPHETAVAGLDESFEGASINPPSAMNLLGTDGFGAVLPIITQGGRRNLGLLTGLGDAQPRLSVLGDCDGFFEFLNQPLT